MTFNDEFLQGVPRLHSMGTLFENFTLTLKHTQKSNKSKKSAEHCEIVQMSAFECMKVQISVNECKKIQAFLRTHFFFLL